MRAETSQDRVRPIIAAPKRPATRYLDAGFCQMKVMTFKTFQPRDDEAAPKLGDDDHGGEGRPLWKQSKESRSRASRLRKMM